MPLPPLAEQRRIVERVEQLMTLCDALEAGLREERAVAEQLADALCNALIEQQPSTAQSVVERADRAVAPALPTRRPSASEVPPVEVEAILLAYALQQHSGTSAERTLGHIKAEKIVHLVEAITQRDLGRHPARMPYGPADFEQFSRAVELGRGWEAFDDIGRDRAASGYRFVPQPQLAKVATRFTEAFGEQAAIAVRIVDLLVPLTSRQAEAVATLYAVWNDLLRDGEAPNDAQIFAAFRAFHPRKERFRPEVLIRWLAWMREHDLVPTGAAKPTVAAQRTELASVLIDNPQIKSAGTSRELEGNGAAKNGVSHDTSGALYQAALDLDAAPVDEGGLYTAARALLVTRGTLTNGDVQAVLNIGAASARALLKRLVAEGLARQEGERRGMRYVQRELSDKRTR